jgi:predicted phage replisome organizer
MADVKWIKITTDIFDDEKILLIESLPDAYAIITVWFKLLCLAGKQNNSGVFMMGQIAYTDKMLATIFRMKESSVTMALQTFEQFGMVEIIDGVITIPNWNKHQSLDAYEKKKERDRLYQAERRAAQKALIGKSSDTSADSPATQSSYVAVSDKEEDKEKEIDKDKKSVRETTHTIFKRLLPEYIIPEALQAKMAEWITYKTERKEPYKEQGMKSLLRQVENNQLTYGEKAVCDLIDECMASGWKGIIFDRLKQKPVRQQQMGFGRKEIVPGWMSNEGQNEMAKYAANLQSRKKTVDDDPDLAARAEALRQKIAEGR